MLLRLSIISAFLFMLQAYLCFGSRGPCIIRRIPHDFDINDKLFSIWPEDSEDDFTERDIISRSKPSNVNSDSSFLENDVIPSATNEEYDVLGLKWPNATVPFVFHNMMSYHGRLEVLNAMNEYHRHTCIQFKKRRDEKDYLVIGSSYPMVCASSVGRQGGPQLLHLGPACTRTRGTPMHELMHALGFFHEHMRPDRNQYVYINYSNIDDALWKNFREVHPVSLLKELDAGYDFGSLMHYRLCAMTNNSWPTIVPKVNPITNVIGQRKGFSEKDIIKLNNYYNCTSISRMPKMFSVKALQATTTQRPSLHDVSTNTALWPKSSLFCCLAVLLYFIFFYQYTF